MRRWLPNRRRPRNSRPRSPISFPSKPLQVVTPDDATKQAIAELEKQMSRTETISVDELMRRRAERGIA